jgi:anti-anti-sigma regulatory factor
MIAAMDYRSVILGDELLAIIEGRFDARIAKRAKADLTRALSNGVKRIVIDLCDCPLVEDAAIAVLAASAVRLVHDGGALYVALDADVFIEIDDEAGVRTVFDR